MMRKMLPLGMVMLLLLASAAWSVPAPVEFLYNGAVDPGQDNSAGPGLNFVNYKGVDGTVIYDPDAIDGAALEIVDETNTDECGSGLRAFYALEPNPGFYYDATIVGRIKTLSDTHVTMDCPPVQSDVAAGNLGILDPLDLANNQFGNSACMHWGGVNGHIEEIYRNQGTTVSGDADYHIFRMTIQGQNGGYSTTSWSENFNDGGAFTADIPLVGQGGWTGGTLPAGTEIKIENTGGAEQRVNMTLGGGATYTDAIRIMSPSAITPDADGKITIELKIQYAAGNTGGNCWRMYFYDEGGAEIASWYGQSTTVRPRRGGTVLATQTVSTTGWDTLKLVADSATKICHYYFNGTEIGSGISYTADTVLKQIDISHWNVVAAGTVYFDDFSVAGGITIPPPERIVRIYKDENPTPVLVINNAAASDSNDNAGGEGFMFGTDDTIALQTVRFDWVSGSNQGAFAPGAEVAVLGHSLIPSAGSFATTIDDAKAKADVTSVVIAEAVVATTYTDDADQSWFFGIEKSDRTAGIRVLSTYGAIPGEKVSIHGVLTTTADGERVIQALNVSQVDPGPFDIPTALYMSNKASGGSAFGAQGGVGSYNTRAWNLDGFDYPDGALPGEGSWTGTSDADRMAVVGGVLQFKRGYDADTISNVTYDELATSYKLSFNVKQGSLGNGDPTQQNEFWRVVLRSDEPAHREIGRWEGWKDHVIPQRVDGTTVNAGDSVPLTTDYKKLTIEFIPSKVPDQPDGDHSNIVNFLVDDVQVWTWTYYSNPTTSPRNPGTIHLQNQSRNYSDPQYVWLDDFALENMEFPVPANVPAVGLNNVGLLVRLYGKVTESFFDILTPSYNTSYFYIDDGSGLLGEPGVPGQKVGVKCMAKNQMFVPPQDVPAVDSYVSVYGILGMQDGQRYLYTLGWDQYTP